MFLDCTSLSWKFNKWVPTLPLSLFFLSHSLSLSFFLSRSHTHTDTPASGLFGRCGGQGVCVTVRACVLDTELWDAADLTVAGVCDSPHPPEQTCLTLTFSPQKQTQTFKTERKKHREKRQHLFRQNTIHLITPVELLNLDLCLYKVKMMCVRCFLGFVRRPHYKSSSYYTITMWCTDCGETSSADACLCNLKPGRKRCHCYI